MAWIRVSGGALIVLAIVVVVLGQLPTTSSDQDGLEARLQDEKRQRLAGLQGVWVLPDWSYHSIQNDSLKVQSDSAENDRLRTLIELQLRKAGIRVFSSAEEYGKVRGKPILTVEVTLTPHGERHSVFVYVRLSELVELVRDSRIQLFADTWHSSGRRGSVITCDDPRIRQWVCDQVDEFSNEFLSVNTKHP